MAKKYRFPGNGEGTFSDGLVGNQSTSNNEFTQNNFSTEGTPIQRDTKTFTTEEFSKPISLEDLTSEVSLEKIKKSFDQSLKIKFNTEKGAKDLFGSSFLRAKVAVDNIGKSFPASLRVFKTTLSAQTVNTAYDITYDGKYDETTFYVTNSAIRNPLGIEYSKTGGKIFDESYDSDRNYSENYRKYVLVYGGKEYPILKSALPKMIYSGPLRVTVKGKPFDVTQTTDEFYISLNNLLSEQKFQEMDDFEQFLLNRDSVPLYKSSFKTPKETSEGKLYFGDEDVIWPVSDNLNIDVTSTLFETYLDKLFSLCEVIDNYKSNLIARFLTTASLTEFDTEDQRTKKVFQLYGRFFDDVKKFIDNIAYMNNVTYDKINNVPDLLLKNLAGLLGMDVITSITEKNIEEHLYKKKDSQYDGISKGLTPFETDIEVYRRIVLNASYLYKSKGTRKPLRFLLNFIGAPESFIEINEYIYKVTNRIDNDVFEEKLKKVIDGEWFDEQVYALMEYTMINDTSDNINVTYRDVNGVLESIIMVPFNGPQGVQPLVVESIEIPTGGEITFQLPNNVTCLPQESKFIRFVVIETSMDADGFNMDDYPVQQVGDTNMTTPKRPTIGNDYFFQQGAGWYKRTDEHTSLSVLDEGRSDLISTPKIIKTKFEDFTYGEKYFNRYRQFPNFTDGWELKTEIDNKKSTPGTDAFILNRKNVDVFLNPGQAVLYDFVRTYNQHNLTYNGVLLNNLTFAQFVEYGYMNGIEVGEGKYGKKYFNLIETFKSYYESGLGKAYDYEKTFSYLEKINPYWIKLVEQFIPATTIWLTGEKIENHNLHRPKYNWEEPCRNDVTVLDLSKQPSFRDMLIDALTKYKNIPDCYERLYKYGNWYLQIKINGKEYTINNDGWDHFFTSTESTIGGSCNDGKGGIGTVETCNNFNNPIYMLCNFEEFITCHPQKCDDFIKLLIQYFNSISEQIYVDDILPQLDGDECAWCCDDDISIGGSNMTTTPNSGSVGRAFEIEGYKDGEDCMDCEGQIKIISNSHCGICFEIDTIEIGVKVLINEGEDNCTHECFVLDPTPFSIDLNRFGGIVYDVNRPEHHSDPLDPRGTIFLTRKLEVTGCDDIDRVFYGTYSYVPLMDSFDRFPVYKHDVEDIYISAYPNTPDGVDGSFIITQGPKGQTTENYGELNDVNILDFENIFKFQGSWAIDRDIKVLDIESDVDVVRHQYSTGDEVGICDRLNDDGFDYIKLYLHGGTYESQGGEVLPYEVEFDCKVIISKGEEITYDEKEDVFIIKIRSGSNKLIHAYDQSGAPIHIDIKERIDLLVGLDFESERWGIYGSDGTYSNYGSCLSHGNYGSYGDNGEYGGYGDYGNYSNYGEYGSSGDGGYFCYGNEFLYYSNISPYCIGLIEYEVKRNCQGYEENVEVYKVVDADVSPILTISDIIIGDTVNIVNVQDVVEGDILISIRPLIGDMSYCDFSQFYYGDTSSVCNYTDDVVMNEVSEVQCGRIYKYVNINEGAVKIEYHHNVLVLENKSNTNFNELLYVCNEEAPTKPIGTLLDDNGNVVSLFFDNEYQIVEKFANDVQVGDYIITTNECGVIMVETIVFDDYCNEGLYVGKHVLNMKEELFIWVNPKEGKRTIYLKNSCENYCCDIECFNPIECDDDLEVEVYRPLVCVDDLEFCINDCTDDISMDDFTTTTTTTKECIDDISTGEFGN